MGVFTLDETHLAKTKRIRKTLTNSDRRSRHMNDEEKMFGDFDGGVPSDEQSI